jgi:hypothetical protein
MITLEKLGSAFVRVKWIQKKEADKSINLFVRRYHLTINMGS